MNVVVLDTDVVSSLLRRRIPDVLARQLAGSVPAITFVTVGELTKWTLVRQWGPRNLATMRAFLAELIVLPYDQRVASRWGELQAYAQLRGRPNPVNDAWIAGCCLAESLRRWVRQAEVEAGQRAGTTSGDAEAFRELRRENRELRRANEILKAAATFFARELDPRLPRS